jgi:POT family proton-dependent oligopeptide transporter
MGAWFMCTAIGNYAAGVIAAVASSGGAATGLAQYASTYTHIAIGGFVLGTAFVISAPSINRLMHGVK